MVAPIYCITIFRHVIIQNNNITNNYLTNIDGNAVSLYTGGEYGIVTLSTEVIDFLEKRQKELYKGDGVSS